MNSSNNTYISLIFCSLLTPLFHPHPSSICYFYVLKQENCETRKGCWSVMSSYTFYRIQSLQHNYIAVQHNYSSNCYCCHLPVEYIMPQDKKSFFWYSLISAFLFLVFPVHFGKVVGGLVSIFWTKKRASGIFRYGWTQCFLVLFLIFLDRKLGLFESYTYNFVIRKWLFWSAFIEFIALKA